MFPQAFKLVIAIIIIICTYPGIINSTGSFDHKELMYLNNYYFDYLTSPDLNRYKRQLDNSEQSCQLPEVPLQTNYNILAKFSNYIPGDFVQHLSVLEVICDEGFNLISPFAHKRSICVNGQWDTSPTSCSRACPSLSSTEGTTVKCSHEGTPLPNCFNAVDKTRVRLSCTTFYEEASLQINPYRVCRNGKWNPSIVKCYATCGIKTPKGTPTIVNGKNTTCGDYPWQVGVYNTKKELICGGAIIDRHAILSAAHCFTDYNGNIYPSENYHIASGKYFREYNDHRDEFAQYSNVLAIHVPHRYKGTESFFSHDIAIVILKDPFVFSKVVQPICIELDEEIQYVHLSENDYGIVTGWGYTIEGDQLSDVLKELVVPYIPYSKCYMEIPSHFRRYITYDKICGGYLNLNMSVCGGDSGGALSFKNVANDRYYAIGIVSMSPSTTEVTACNSNTYSVYTGLSHHIKFVVDHLLFYKLEQHIECQSQQDCIHREAENNINSCRFPNFPLNGKYICRHQNNTFVPGDYVPMSSTLTLSCDIGYEVRSSDTTLSHCVDGGQWIPTPGICKELNAKSADCFVLGEEGDGKCISVESCKPIMDYLKGLPFTNEFLTALKKYQCGFDGKIPKVCCYDNKYIEGLTFRSDVSNHKNINLLPKQCGLNFIKSNIIVSGKANLFEFPWMAVSLHQKTANWPYLCVGTIINDRYILTSAYCTTHETNWRVGDYQFGSNPDCDIESENITVCADPFQDVEIEEYIAHSSFGMVDYNFTNDIGLLRLRTPLRFTSSVQPICLPIYDEFIINDFTGTLLIMSGWDNEKSVESDSYLIRRNISVLSETDCFNLDDSNTQHLCIHNIDNVFCQVDYGEPVQGIKLVNSNHHYVQFGITSLGSFLDCYIISQKSVTRVDYFINWILDNLNV